MTRTDPRTKLEILDQPDSLRDTVYQQHGNIQKIARKIVAKGCERLYLVGMGSSYSAALMGMIFSRHISSILIETYRGYELEFEEPVGVGGNCCVVPISFSGETEDVVSALRFAKSRGAYVVSISGPEENTLAREADDAIRIVSKDTKAMVAAHLTQVALLYLLLGYIAKYRDGSSKIDELRQELDTLIQKLPNVMLSEDYGQEKPKIVSVASAAGKIPGPFLAHYTASKFAVVGFTKAVALELAPFGITVNCVCPGYVQTSMQERELVWEGKLRGITADEVKQGYLTQVPLGRLATPDDVATIVAFLCSHDSDYMTGQAVNVTGGQVMI